MRAGESDGGRGEEEEGGESRTEDGGRGKRAWVRARVGAAQRVWVGTF